MKLERQLQWVTTGNNMVLAYFFTLYVNYFWINTSPRSTQIKHGRCYLSAQLCVLINLCNLNRRKVGSDHFRVTRWTLGHWLIGYGCIIHLEHRIGVWPCGPCRWLSPRWRVGCWECFSKGKPKKMIYDLLSNFSSSAEVLHFLFLTQCTTSWFWSNVAVFITGHITR